jgi:MoaA/NifB/PqqE/SkfB family radical SAM enzyme
MKSWINPYVRMISRYIASKFKAWKPLAAFYNVTLRCNLRCSFCSLWRRSEYREVDHENAVKIIRRIGEAGIPGLGFSGGEPLLRADLVGLAFEAKDYGMITSVNTNGTLISEGNAERLSKAFDYIILSLDDIGILHDEVRGIRGVYDKVLEAVDILKRYGATVGINTVATRDNIPRITMLWRNLSDRVDFFTIQPVNPPQMVDKRLSSKLIEELYTFRKTANASIPLPRSYLDGMAKYMSGDICKICDAGRLYLAIQPNGDVIPCSIRDDAILGNILEEDLESIMDRNRKDIVHIVDKCGGCWLTCTTGISLTFRKPMEVIGSYVKLGLRIC